jgi:hypothetical protein
VFTCLFQPKSPTPLLSASHHGQGPPFLGRVISGTEPGSDQQLAARASKNVGPETPGRRIFHRAARYWETCRGSRSLAWLLGLPRCHGWMRDVGAAALSDHSVTMDEFASLVAVRQSSHPSDRSRLKVSHHTYVGASQSHLTSQRDTSSSHLDKSCAITSWSIIVSRCDSCGIRSIHYLGYWLLVNI